MNLLYIPVNEQETWAECINKSTQQSTQFFSYVTIKAQEIFSIVEAEALKRYAQIQDKIHEIEVLPIVRDIYHLCNQVEKIFNIAACLLWVSSYSSPLRILFGLAQMLAGVALTVFSESVIMASDLKTDKELIGKWKVLSKFGAHLIVHGSLNFCRGTIESYINNFTFSLANPALVVPNILFGRNFSPLYIYKNLPKNETQTPAPPCDEPIQNKGTPIQVPNINLRPQDIVLGPTLLATGKV